MRVLFIAPRIQDMYKDIEAEMIRQGHEVVVIQDKILRADPHIVRIPFLVPIKKIIWNILSKKHWDSIIAKDKNLIKPFDLVFIISGESVNKYILDYLKRKNPKLKTVFYTWDACNFYRYDRFLSIVDKCYTFELDDVKKDNRWIFLPIYCKESKHVNNYEYDYDLFTIGSCHDGRYSFLKKILPQLENNNIKYYIKVVTVPIIITIREKIKLFFLCKEKRSLRLEEIKFSHGLENREILSTEKIINEEYKKISNRSRCVLDDQREGQSGLTARFMWALADGKKIITTNKWAYQYSFVCKEQVRIIDKKDPVIPIDFLKETEYRKSEMKDFYIENWVNTILNF